MKHVGSGNAVNMWIEGDMVKRVSFNPHGNVEIALREGLNIMKSGIIELNGIYASITKKRVTAYADCECSTELFHLVFSESNRKIGKITNFSLRAGRTCAAHCMDTCFGHCYDENSAKLYPSVAEARNANTDAVMNYFEHAMVLIDMYLAKYNPQYFRVHVGGDFYCSEYFEAWNEIIKAHPETQFLAYTKQYDVIRYALFTDRIELADNFNLYMSIWKGIAEPWDLIKVLPTACMYDGSSEIIDKSATICPGSCDGCKLCYTSASVVFVYHGNGISKKKHEALMKAASILFKKYAEI